MNGTHFHWKITKICPSMQIFTQVSLEDSKPFPNCSSSTPKISSKLLDYQSKLKIPLLSSGADWWSTPPDTTFLSHKSSRLSTICFTLSWTCCIGTSSMRILSPCKSQMFLNWVNTAALGESSPKPTLNKSSSMPELEAFVLFQKSTHQPTPNLGEGVRNTKRSLWLATESIWDNSTPPFPSLGK